MSKRFAILWIVALLIMFAMVMLLPRAHALPHGWDPNNPVAQWFESLKQPNKPKASCCGKSDAYTIVIEQEPIGDKDGEMGTAHITDGSAITFPDESKRIPIPDGTVFKFPLSKMNPLQNGNPTKTAWVFLSWNARLQKIETIYCVIPLPPSY